MNQARDKNQDQFERFAEEYLSEVVPLIEDLEICTLHLTDPQLKAKNLNMLARTVHSIKGAAGSYGYDLLSSICHNFEDRISAIHMDGGNVEDQVDGLLKYVDLLKEARLAYTNKDQNALKNVRQKMGGQKPVATAVETQSAPALQRVLVVEKMRLMMNMINRALKEKNNSTLEISGAKDGYEALGRLLKERFDFVIMSNMADWLTGQEILQILSRGSSPNKNTPFVLLTGTDKMDLSGISVPVKIVTKTDQLAADLGKALESIISTKPSAEVQNKKSLSNKKINLFLIDDSIDIHRLVELAFKKYPEVTFSGAMTGADGIAKLGAGTLPDLLLIDFQLPDTNGVELSRKIKTLYPKLPFAFLTGATAEEEKKILLAENPKAIFKKPFPPMALAQSVIDLMVKIEK